MTKWSITWAACFGALATTRADSIEHYIDAKLDGGLKAGELDAVVGQLADRWNPKENGASPGIGLLIQSIRNARKQAAGIDTSEPYDVTMARRAIRTLPVDGLARWDAICAVNQDYRGRVIKDAMQSGGLTVPWWAHDDVPCTRRQDRPKNGASVTQAVKTAARAIQDADRAF
jgi:hypothetical protein